jgi:hypothetical protein
MIKPGVVVAVVGSSQSGKTAYVRHKIAGFARSIVWDCEGQYSGHKVDSPRALTALIKKTGAGAGCIVYRPRSLKEFDFFCRAAFVWGALGGAAGKQTAVIAEETSDVTSPGKAPEGYGQLIRKGKKRGISIYAITQRLAESDKTAIGNADFVHCCRMVLPIDRKYMSNILDVPVDHLQNLLCDQDKKIFDYVQRDLGRDVLSRGVLTFPRKKAKFSKLLH